ncbi:uncharacterized protein LOC143224990 isoform X2 [Tachypleus tridentatus]|uniref:uncharacterized protein LOC143224990 isoform X2 n=1 Tax=Tachypleus tridentatus TaxID=6853 RepID=UPI003FD3CBE4
MNIQSYGYLKGFIVIFLAIKSERLCTGAELRCEPPPSVPNAVPDIDYQVSYAVGTVVTYKCEKGYRDPAVYKLKTDKSSISQCRVNNSEHAYWIKPSLQCKPQCFSWDLKNARGLKIILEGNYMEGENLLFFCISGYDRVENAVITCNSGIWNTTLMPCQPAKCNYSPPSVVNGFTTVLNGTHGTTVTYSCNQFYSLQTSGSIRCSYGSWIGSPAVCKDTRCYPSDLVHWDGFRTKGMKNVYYNFETAHVSCEHGYKKMANIICNRGIWTSLSSKHYPCKHGYCHKPETDGGIVYEGRFCLASFYCYERANSKYYKEGEKLYLTCSQDGVKAQMRCEKGKWTPNLKCKDYELTETKILNLNRSTTTSETKFHASNHKSIVWKGFETHCRIGVHDKHLRIYKAIDGIRLKSGDRIKAGTRIVFHCSHVGIMRLTGVKEMYCYSGKWTEEFPYCFVPTGPRGIYFIHESANLHLFCKTVAGLQNVFWITDVQGNLKQNIVYAESDKPISHIEFNATYAHSGNYTCLYRTQDSVTVNLVVTDYLPYTSKVPKRHKHATSKTERTSRIPKVCDTTTSFNTDSTTTPAQDQDTTTSFNTDSTTTPAQEEDTTASSKLDSTTTPAQDQDTTTSSKLESTTLLVQEEDTIASSKLESTTLLVQEEDTIASSKLDSTTVLVQEEETIALSKLDSTTLLVQEEDTIASSKLESTTLLVQEEDTIASSKLDSTTVLVQEEETIALSKFDSTTVLVQEEETIALSKLDSTTLLVQEEDTIASSKLDSTTVLVQEEDTIALSKLDSTTLLVQEEDTIASPKLESTTLLVQEEDTIASSKFEYTRASHAYDTTTGSPAVSLKLESTERAQKDHENTSPLMFNTSEPPNFQLDKVVEENKINCIVDFNDDDIRIFHKRRRIKSGDIVPDGGRIVFHCYPVGRSRLFGFSETRCHRGRWLDKGFPTCQRNHVLGDVAIKFSKKGVIKPGGVVVFPTSEDLCIYCKTIGWTGEPQWTSVTFYASIDYCSSWWDPQCSYVCLETTSVLSGNYKCYVPHGRNLTIELSFQDIRCPPIRRKELIVRYEKWLLPNSIVHFSCGGSLQLVGAKKATCLQSGKWSKRIPYCQDQN